MCVCECPARLCSSCNMGGYKITLDTKSYLGFLKIHVGLHEENLIILHVFFGIQSNHDLNSSRPYKTKTISYQFYVGLYAEKTRDFSEN